MKRIAFVLMVFTIILLLVGCDGDSSTMTSVYNVICSDGGWVGQAYYFRGQFVTYPEGNPIYINKRCTIICTDIYVRVPYIGSGRINFAPQCGN